MQDKLTFQEQLMAIRAFVKQTQEPMKKSKQRKKKE